MSVSGGDAPVAGASRPPISRRRVLGLAAGGVLAGSAAWIIRGDGSPARLRPGATGQVLRQPDILDSRHGRLEVDLVAAPGAEVAGRDTSALAYNGQTPGPTLRLRPGDTLALRLTNRLDEPTNLHTHGLRVSPAGNGDNPFVRVEPGASFSYLIQVPRDHPVGTYWYHPHHHGTAADQQFGGLAGALLVVPEGPLGESASDVEVDDDVVLVVTDITLNADGRVAAVSDTARSLGRQGELLLINGQHRTAIPAVVGSTARWRIVNACTSQVLRLRLDGHRLTQIALDGSYLRRPLDLDAVTLAPGNRADVVVRAGSSGAYELIAESYDRGRMGDRSTARPPMPLATFAVAATSIRSAPARAWRLPPVEQPVAPAVPGASSRQIEFTMRMAGAQMTFELDGRAFDPRRDDQSVVLGATEDWLLTNLGPLDHPFHLHTWPFWVVAGSDGLPPAGILQDVVLVPARGWVHLRVPFTENPGRAVYHCHIVDHSDAGMMGVIEVAAER